MKSAFLLYEGIEPIDLGAIGTISMAKRVIPSLEYFTVAESMFPVVLANGLRILPDFEFAAVPQFDVLMIPGGPGWKKASENDSIKRFIASQGNETVLCSFCTGAMILASAGVLEGLRATTKREVTGAERPPLHDLSVRFPGIETMHALLVDEGRIVTGGGVSLCVDTVIYLLSKRFGRPAVDEVLRIMEYAAAHESNLARLPTVIAH